MTATTATLCECGNEHRPGHGQNARDCQSRDLLACAYRTGIIHARRGARRAVDTCRRLYGQVAADAYAHGYDTVEGHQ